MIMATVLRLQIHGIHVGQVDRHTGQHGTRGSEVGECADYCLLGCDVVSEDPNASLRIEGLIKICSVVSEMRYVKAMTDGDNLLTLR